MRGVGRDVMIALDIAELAVQKAIDRTTARRELEQDARNRRVRELTGLRNEVVRVRDSIGAADEGAVRGL